MSKFKRLLSLESVKFLNGGIFMKAISFLLNYILADYMEYDASKTYIAVLAFDFILGYVINRFYVFKAEESKSHRQVFFQFVSAGISFRVLNWLIYMFLIKKLELYILTSQLISTIIVLLAKYFLYKKIFK